jgi:hypothetical protein
MIFNNKFTNHRWKNKRLGRALTYPVNLQFTVLTAQMIPDALNLQFSAILRKIAFSTIKKLRKNAKISLQTIYKSSSTKVSRIQIKHHKKRIQINHHKKRIQIKHHKKRIHFCQVQIRIHRSFCLFKTMSGTALLLPVMSLYRFKTLIQMFFSLETEE